MISLPWIHLFLLLLAGAAIRILPGAATSPPSLIYTGTLRSVCQKYCLCAHCVHIVSAHIACVHIAHTNRFLQRSSRCLRSGMWVVPVVPWVEVLRWLGGGLEVLVVGWKYWWLVHTTVGGRTRARFTLIKLRPVCELRPASLFSFAAQIRPGVCQQSLTKVSILE